MSAGVRLASGVVAVPTPILCRDLTERVYAWREPLCMQVTARIGVHELFEWTYFAACPANACVSERRLIVSNLTWYPPAGIEHIV